MMLPGATSMAVAAGLEEALRYHLARRRAEGLFEACKEALSIAQEAIYLHDDGLLEQRVDVPGETYRTARCLIKQLDLDELLPIEP